MCYPVCLWQCIVRVGSCRMGCGRPGPVFGPVAQYFLACGGGCVRIITLGSNKHNRDWCSLKPSGQHICLKFGHPRSDSQLASLFNSHVYSGFWGHDNFSHNIFLNLCSSLFSPPPSFIYTWVKKVCKKGLKCCNILQQSSLIYCSNIILKTQGMAYCN